MKKSKIWMLIIALVLMFCPKYLPPLFGLNQVGSITLGITVGTLILLLGVSLSWPVFLCMFAFAFNGVYSLNQVISMCLGNSILWFMMLNGVVIGTIEKTGLYRRVALWLACRPITRKSPWLFLAAFLFSCLLCGSLMNTTAVYLLFLALSTEVLQQLKVEKGHPFAGAFMIAVMAASNVSHAITPFGHSVTVMGLDYFQPYGGLDFLQYSVVGYVCAVLGLVVMVVAMRHLFRADVSPLVNFDPTTLKRARTPLSRQELAGAVVMGGIILWWLAPTLLQSAAPQTSAFLSSNLGILAPVLAGLAALCLIHFDGEPVMNIGEAIKAAPWHAGLVVAVSLFLGSALQNEEGNIVEAVSALLEPVCSQLPPLAFVALITLFVMVMSNFTSCTLSMMVAAIITITLIQGGAITGIHGGALSIALAISAQAAFATAPASAPAAIFAGERWVSTGRQLKDGFIYAFLWWAVSLVGYGIAAALF